MSNQTIRAALLKHGAAYGGWDLGHRLACERIAAAAFAHQSVTEFEPLYAILKKQWKIFRGGGTPWSASQLFDAMRALDPALRTLRLSDLQDGDLPRIAAAVRNLAPMKPVNGISIVAVSKVLYFWNPDLFVIVDDAAMWQWALRHPWAKEPIQTVRRRIESMLAPDDQRNNGSKCDTISYIAVLRWSADVIRANPELRPSATNYLRSRVTPTDPLIAPEAAVVEWLLLGLSELPPCGVEAGPN